MPPAEPAAPPAAPAAPPAAARDRWRFAKGLLAGAIGAVVAFEGLSLWRKLKGGEKADGEPEEDGARKNALANPGMPQIAAPPIIPFPMPMPIPMPMPMPMMGMGMGMQGMQGMQQAPPQANPYEEDDDDPEVHRKKRRGARRRRNQAIIEAFESEEDFE